MMFSVAWCFCKGKLIDPMNTYGRIVFFYDPAEWRMPAIYSSGRTVFSEPARNRASGCMPVACPSDFRSANSALGFAFLELGEPPPRLDQTAEDAPQRLVGQLLQASFEIIQIIGWFLDTGNTSFQLPRNHPAKRVPAELDFFDTAVFRQPAVALIVCSQITDVKNIATQQSDQPEPPPQIVLDTFANTLFAMCRARSDPALGLPGFSRFQSCDNRLCLAGQKNPRRSRLAERCDSLDDLRTEADQLLLFIWQGFLQRRPSLSPFPS